MIEKGGRTPRLGGTGHVDPDGPIRPDTEVGDTNDVATWIQNRPGNPSSKPVAERASQLPPVTR